MALLCRDARPDDLDAMLELYRQLGPEDPVLSADDARSSFAALLASDMTNLLVAEHDGQVAATCLLLIVPNLTRGGRPFAVIENVVTLARHRRKGLGRGAPAGGAGPRLGRQQLQDHDRDRPHRRGRAALLRGGGGFSKGGKTFFEARRLG